jgi:hypothetical protein
MTIGVHTKPTKSNVAWPTPPTNSITSDSITGPDRHQPRLPYRRTSQINDVLLSSKPRVIIPHNGKSFAAPPL